MAMKWLPGKTALGQGSSCILQCPLQSLDRPVTRGRSSRRARFNVYNTLGAPNDSKVLYSHCDMILRLVEDPASLVLVVVSTHPSSLDLCDLEVKLNNAMEVVSFILYWNRLREMYLDRSPASPHGVPGFALFMPRSP